MASSRDKLILAGLFLAKFDAEGLRALGFATFTEAFNTLALSLGEKPASLKNYRDEFDPHFPNPRRGWHQRPMRPNCARIMAEYGALGVREFADLVKSRISVLGDMAPFGEDGETTFAKRLITGQAAERYFERHCPSIAPFQGYELANTTAFGCGFDYRLSMPDRPFLAVEVKGMAAPEGTVQLTQKEHRAAHTLGDRFFLFVVRNFAETPCHTIVRDPLRSHLVFERREQRIVQEWWTATIPRTTPA